MKKKLKLYHVWRTDKWDYDDYDSFVVACYSRAEAMRTNPSGVEGYSWPTIPQVITAQLIGHASQHVKPGIIVASFNAG